MLFKYGNFVQGSLLSEDVMVEVTKSLLEHVECTCLAVVPVRAFSMLLALIQNNKVIFSKQTSRGFSGGVDSTFHVLVLVFLALGQSVFWNSSINRQKHITILPTGYARFLFVIE